MTTPQQKNMTNSGSILIELTGPSACGKTTLAKRLHAELTIRGFPCEYVQESARMIPAIDLERAHHDIGYAKQLQAIMMAHQILRLQNACKKPQVVIADRALVPDFGIYADIYLTGVDAVFTRDYAATCAAYSSALKCGRRYLFRLPPREFEHDGLRLRSIYEVEVAKFKEFTSPTIIDVTAKDLEGQMAEVLKCLK
jgi:hypothetical protein